LRHTFNMIDDRRIMGPNPYDATLWTIKRRRRQWIVLNGSDYLIHEAETKAAAQAWVAQALADQNEVI
jgi:hypothetical protein